jgi:hypothetical protein
MPDGGDDGFSARTVWLQVRVLPSPPRTLALPEISCNRSNTPHLAGFVTAFRSPNETTGVHESCFGAFVSGPEIPFPGKQRPVGAETGSKSRVTAC